MNPHQSVFFQCVYSFQASTCSPDRGHVLDFCIMMIIWGFGWLNPLTHARLNRMSSAPPVPPFQLPRLTECLYSLPTAVTNPSMPGMHGTQDTQANKLPGRLGRREHVSGTESSLGTSNVAQGQNSGLIWSPTSACWPHLCVSNVPTSVQKMSQLQTWTEKRKMDWQCAISPDALPQHARLTSTSMCPTASALPPHVYPRRGETLTELMLINTDWDSIASGSCCCSWFHQASSPSPPRWSKQIILWGISRFLQQSHRAVLAIDQMWYVDMGDDSDLQHGFVDSVFDLCLSVSQ